MMQVLNETDLAHIKKLLEDEKKKILHNLSSLKTQDPYSNPDRVNDNAASDAEASEERDHERVEALEKELVSKQKEIDETLSRITKGKYGICQGDHKPIERDRLLANPTARYSLRYLSKHPQS